MFADARHAAATHALQRDMMAALYSGAGAAEMIFRAAIRRRCHSADMPLRCRCHFTPPYYSAAAATPRCHYAAVIDITFIMLMLMPLAAAAICRRLCCRCLAPRAAFAYDFRAGALLLRQYCHTYDAMFYDDAAMMAIRR